MTTITIPTKFGYPKFDIYINGKKYTLQSGVEISVEDHVAEVIEKALALAPKYSKNLSKFAQRTEGSISDVNESDLEGIEAIYSYSFYNCDSLISVVVPNGVKRIDGFAFAYCEKLMKVVLPSSVTNIDGRAFAESSNLIRVILKSQKPPIITTSTVEYIPKTCVFEVPSESLSAYKSASVWSTIANQIVAIKE